MRALRKCLSLGLFAGICAGLVAACGGNGGGDGAPTPEADVAWTAAIEDDGAALLITPATALRGDRAYAIVLTAEIADASGRALQASPAFRRVKGTSESDGDGPVALFADDVEAEGNPYPDPRLVRENLTVHIPARFIWRGLPDIPRLALARQLVRQTANEVEAIHGFSTTAPLRIPTSAPVDLATATPDTLRFFELDPPALFFSEVLRAAERRGIARDDVALAFAFPTQPTEQDLREIRDLLLARTAQMPPRITFTDPDPSDALPIGVFAAADAPFADYLEKHPAVGLVARGLMDAPDFRDARGIFDPARVRGTSAPAVAVIDVVLTLPAAGAAPYPVVVLQHGFAGSNLAMLDLAAQLADHGLASIAISALSHGLRGSPLDLLTSSAVQVRDTFRQTIVDQMSLVRAIEAGIDVNGDGEADLRTEDTHYLGVSLGGILGSTFVAVENNVQAAVLNVAGGRVAFLGDNPGTRAIYQSSFSSRAQLPIDDPAFEVFVQRMLEVGQQGLDGADPLNFARRWMLEPFPGVPPRRILLQEGIGDTLVANESTEALAQAGGLAADTVMSNPDGVSGLWRFAPPGGHGILSRADVRAQAIEFLSSDGTRIIDPAAVL